MNEKSNFVKQHPYDGQMIVNLYEVVSIDEAEDSYHAKVLLTDGKWIKLDISFEEAKKRVSAK